MPPAKPSTLLDIRVVYCGDNHEQLAKLPVQCVDLIKTQVGDKGIDGRIFPVSALENRRKATADELQLEDRFYPIQVKQKDKVGRPDIDSFEAISGLGPSAKAWIRAANCSWEAAKSPAVQVAWAA